MLLHTDHPSVVFRVSKGYTLFDPVELEGSSIAAERFLLALKKKGETMRERIVNCIALVSVCTSSHIYSHSEDVDLNALEDNSKGGGMEDSSGTSPTNARLS